MKILNALAVVATLAAAAPLPARAQDDGLDPAKAAAFDKRVFGAPVGQKASACFVRR